MLTLAHHAQGVMRFAYILASRPHGALYTEQAGDLWQALDAHRRGAVAHTARYRIGTLVWFEPFEDPGACATRVRRIKGWQRRWKIELIEAANPEWRGLTWQIGRAEAQLPRA